MAYILAMRPTNRLRELRKKAGLTQAELALRTGVTQPSISQIENDARPMDLDDMRTLARILECTPADLLDEQDNPDRLTEDERALLRNFRLANETQREMLQRVAEPVQSFKPAPAEDDNGRLPKRVA